MEAVRPRPLRPPPPVESSADDAPGHDVDDVPTAASRAPREAAPNMRDRAALVRLDGTCAGQAIMLEKGPVIRIGRGGDAEVRIDDDGVSRMHAAIRYDGSAFLIMDLGSRNGTLIRGAPVTQHTLVDGDVVHFSARTSFRFTLMDAREEALYRRLFESSVKDPLTGAHNRQSFDERLRAEVAYAKRHRAVMSIVLIDIDHFKKVNDTHGHRAGDAVLKYVTGIATSRLRTEDVFARYGGEEFVAILRGTDLAGAARAAERLRAAIGGACAIHEGVPVPVTISAGCAALTCAVGSTGEELVDIADRRLYAAKRAGRNRVVSAG
jgi:two-component system, cell cycle response regulator